MREPNRRPPKHYWKPNGVWFAGIFAMPYFGYVAFEKGELWLGFLCASLSPVCLWLLVKNIKWLCAFKRDGKRDRSW